MLAGDPRRIRLAYSLMFTLPGTPVLRYGDEIGMGDDLALKERDCARTPMQWTAEHQGGFTKAERTVLPPIDHGPLRLRPCERRRPAARPGLIAELDAEPDPPAQGGAGDRLGRRDRGPDRPELGPGPALHVARQCAVLCVHNLASEPVEVALESGAAEPEHDILIDVLTGSRSEVGPDGKHCLFLEGYGYHWFRVGGLDALLRRTPG